MDTHDPRAEHLHRTGRSDLRNGVMTLHGPVNQILAARAARPVTASWLRTVRRVQLQPVARGIPLHDNAKALPVF